MLQVYKARMNIGLGLWVVLVLVQVILKKSGYGNSILNSLFWLAAMYTQKGKVTQGYGDCLGFLAYLDTLFLSFSGTKINNIPFLIKGIYETKI